MIRLPKSLFPSFIHLRLNVHALNDTPAAIPPQSLLSAAPNPFDRMLTCFPL